MNFFRTCNLNNEIINNHSISKEDLELFYSFLSSKQIYELYFKNDKKTIVDNIPYIVSEWFKFLQQNKKISSSPVTEDIVFDSSIYRATFGNKYTLKQLAENPIYYSRGSNGSGVYAVADSRIGLNYLRNHLTKKFSAFEDKVGNILKIGVNENAVVMSKNNLQAAQNRFISEINTMNIDNPLKQTFIRFLNTDISITALLLGADMMFIPNGHVIVLNKNALIFPTSEKELKNQTLQVDLEKFRSRDLCEQQKVNNFLQLQ